MTASALAQRSLLNELDAVMLERLLKVLRLAPSEAWMIDAFPELVSPYINTAGELGAVWYDSLAPTASYKAVVAPLPPVQQLKASASWAVYSRGVTLDLLAGSAQRYLFNGSRDTVQLNVSRERGARWDRYASFTACEFCRLMVLDAGKYNSEDSAGFNAHDNCRCMAVPSRSGGEQYSPPSYVEKWQDEYESAKALAGSTDRSDLMRAYRQLAKEGSE